MGETVSSYTVGPETVQLALGTDAPNGPPQVVMKPDGEILREANRPADAANVSNDPPSSHRYQKDSDSCGAAGESARAWLEAKAVRVMRHQHRPNDVITDSLGHPIEVHSLTA